MEACYNSVVIGGGFYGCILAIELARRGAKVLIIEKEGDILARASKNNQARVHNGYHYPRSLLTALRSRINFSAFISDYAPSIYHTFDNYYAVARKNSNITSAQFRLFCHRIDAPLKPVADQIRRLFNPELIEDLFAVKEYVYDHTKLRQILLNDITKRGITTLLEAKAGKVEAIQDGRIRLHCHQHSKDLTILAEQVFNCTYSQINQIMADSRLALVPLKHELAEIALVEVPPELAQFGITVVCGPFFSLLPFPSRGLHTLSHVRYTPHCAWEEGKSAYINAHERLAHARKDSAFPYMIRDTQRYLPIAQECRQRDSIWEVKTLLPASEVDDSRPILYRKNQGLPNFHVVLGAKLDNVYDLLRAV